MPSTIERDGSLPLAFFGKSKDVRDPAFEVGFSAPSAVLNRTVDFAPGDFLCNAVASFTDIRCSDISYSFD